MTDSALCARHTKNRFWELSLIFFLASWSNLGCQSPGPRPSPASGYHAELSSSRVVDGSLLVVSLRLPPEVSETGWKVSFGDQESIFFPSSDPALRLALIGVPHHHPPGATEVQVSGQGTVLRLPLEIVDGKYPSEILKVSDRKVNPRKKDLVRIRREIREVSEIYRRVTPVRYWQGTFQLPVPSEVTSVYGTKRLYNGQMKNFHSGLDLRAPTGTPIRAPEAGMVAMAKDLFFTGNTVLIDHGFGLVTLYAHLSKLSVKVGQVVKRGELLGLSGMTGRTTGPHLHWAAIVHAVKIDPAELTRVLK